MERVTGIGPAYPAWKAGVLPLNYTRKPWLFSQSILAYANLFVKHKIFNKGENPPYPIDESFFSTSWK